MEKISNAQMMSGWLCLVLAGYLFGCLVCWNFNPAEWHWIARLFQAIYQVGILWTALSVYSDEKRKDKP